MRILLIIWYLTWDLTTKLTKLKKVSYYIILPKFKALPCILANPCLNGAACTNNNLGGYTCTCASGYTGTNCQYGM